MGGWSTREAERLLVFVTPTVVDARGKKVDPPFEAHSQIRIDAKFVAASEQVLVKLGLQSLFTEENESKEVVRCSDADGRSFVNSIKQSPGGEVLSAPSMLTLPGRQAQIKIGANGTVPAKNQFVGDSFDCLPTLAADGRSVDLEVTAEYTQAANGNGQ
jgi:type II secretory pathway component GspD/PulD (secretin)